MKPAQPVKREFEVGLSLVFPSLENRLVEYIRHGTQTLIASFDVSSDKISQESIGQTRTESDFTTHLQPDFFPCC